MRERIWAWAKTNPLPALTILGVALYGLLRLPYSVYYGSLGASPEEVGLSYAETLARSTAGIAVAALALGVAAAVAAGVLTFLAFYARLGWAILRVRGLSKKKLISESDEEHERDVPRRRRFLTIVLRGQQQEVDELLAAGSEYRRLALLGVRTRDEQEQVDEFRIKNDREVSAVIRAEVRRVARRYGALGAAATALVIGFGLPAVAYADAQLVRECSRPALGQFGLFAVRGARSVLFRVDDSGSTTPMLADRRLMFLGSGGDRLVLFDCRHGRVLRLPATGVVVASE